MNFDWKKVAAFAKKNVVSLVATVLLLASLGAILFYIDGGFAGVRQEVSQRAAVAGQLRQIRESPYPDIKLDQGGRRAGDDRLSGFPTRATIEEGRRVMQRVRQQSQSLLDSVVERNRRAPLGFNDPQRTLAQNYEAATRSWPLAGQARQFHRDDWVRRYRAYLALDDGFNEETGSFAPGSLPGLLRATRPPTRESIQRAQETRQAAIEAQSPRDSESEDFLDEEGVRQRVSRELSQLERGLKFTRADDHLIYLDADALTPHPLAQSTERPDSAQIFEAQVQLWVKEEVLSRLIDANLDALANLPDREQNVIAAPVKQVVALDVPAEFPSGRAPTASQPAGGFDGGFGGGEDQGFTDYDENYWDEGQSQDPGGGQGGFGAPPATPAAPAPAAPGAGGPSGPARPGAPRQAPTAVEPQIAVVVDPAAELPRDFALSPVGRKGHTPFFDAVRFTLRVRVEAVAVADVLRALQVDTHLTVLNVREFRPVDPVVALADGYVFGPDPVVELLIEGEMLLLRSWTVPLMPDEIRTRLNAFTPAAGDLTVAGF